MSRIAAGGVAHAGRPRAAAGPRACPRQNSSTSFAHERGQVVRVARGDEALVDVDLLVDPGRARVAQVGLQRRPRGERAAAHDAGVDQRPRAVADRRDRLGLVEERAHERDRVLVGAQEVGVGDAAGQHQAVVARGVGRRRGVVDRERVALVEVVEALDVAGLERDQLRRAAGVLDGLPRIGQLHLLHAVGGEERDRLALQLCRPCRLLSVGVSRARLPPVAGRRKPGARGAVCSRTARGSRRAMEYLIPLVLVLLLVAGFVDVPGAQRDEEERPGRDRRSDAPGIGADDDAARRHDRARRRADASDGHDRRATRDGAGAHVARARRGRGHAQRLGRDDDEQPAAAGLRAARQPRRLTARAHVQVRLRSSCAACVYALRRSGHNHRVASLQVPDALHITR